MSQDKQQINSKGEFTRLIRESEDAKYFKHLARNNPSFLDLTGAKIKKKFPRFARYTCQVLNQTRGNIKRAPEKEKDKDPSEILQPSELPTSTNYTETTTTSTPVQVPSTTATVDFDPASMNASEVLRRSK